MIRAYYAGVTKLEHCSLHSSELGMSAGANAVVARHIDGALAAAENAAAELAATPRGVAVPDVSARLRVAVPFPAVLRPSAAPEVAVVPPVESALPGVGADIAPPGCAAVPLPAADNGHAPVDAVCRHSRGDNAEAPQAVLADDRPWAGEVQHQTHGDP